MIKYAVQTKNVVQNISYVQGQTLPPISIPTDLPIKRILITLSGTPTGSVGGGAAGALNNAFTIPALAAALGTFTIASSPRDGSDGIQIKQLPATMAWFDSWMMKAQQPQFTDISAATPATACNVTVPIEFQDTRLPIEQQHLTALEAMRYGGQNTLNLSIFTGFLQAAVTIPDQVAIGGGTYSGAAVGVGTLVISVNVEQLVPIGFQWPAFNGKGAFPFLDRDFEYVPMAGLSNSQSNGIQLNRRNIQANTWWLNSSRVVTTFVESGVNNLGSTPTPQLVEKLGATDKNRVDPGSLRAQTLQHFLSGTTLPAGIYGVDDWQSNLDLMYSLANVQGVHQWDLNLGTTPGGATDQVVRVFHVTYNPSAAAKPFVNSLA